jgi:hypothetical protein
MATEVDIVNRALVKLGAKRILTLADNVKEAREASFIYDMVRDEEMRAHNWKFAIRRASIEYLLPDLLTPYSPVTGYDVGDIAGTYYCTAATTGNAPPDNRYWYNLVPEFGFNYAYLLPADHLRLIQAGEYFPGLDLTDYANLPNTDYEIEGRFILTNLPEPLKIRYIARVEDTAQYDPLFVEALACKLAYELCETITNSDSLKERLERDYRIQIVRAISRNAIESPPARVADDTWVMSRL